MPVAANRHAASRKPNGRFGPGNPGRRAGTRNRVSGRVAMAILQDFEAHQEEILYRLRGSWLPVYVRLVSSLLPKTVDIALPDPDAWSEAEVAQKVMAARAALDRIDEGRGTLLELEAVLLGEAEPLSEP